MLKNTENIYVAVWQFTCSFSVNFELFKAHYLKSVLQITFTFSVIANCALALKSVNSGVFFNLSRIYAH